MKQGKLRGYSNLKKIIKMFELMFGFINKLQSNKKKRLIICGVEKNTWVEV